MNEQAKLDMKTWMDAMHDGPLFSDLLNLNNYPSAREPVGWTPGTHPRLARVLRFMERRLVERAAQRAEHAFSRLSYRLLNQAQAWDKQPIYPPRPAKIEWGQAPIPPVPNGLVGFAMGDDGQAKPVYLDDDGRAVVRDPE